MGKIKTMLLGLLCVAMVLGITGCVPSLQPLYTDEDLVTDSRLDGLWLEGEDLTTGKAKSTWNFQKITDKQAYEAILTQDGKTSRFSVHLVKLGGNLFMDTYPMEMNLESANEYYKMHFIKGHIIARINFGEKNVLRVATLNYNWLARQYKDGKLTLPHEEVENQIILTGSIHELQQFLKEHGDDAFGEPIVLRRKRG
ncbi:MAG TPA: hypothetical protein VF531_11460 [Bacillota bacterium]